MTAFSDPRLAIFLGLIACTSGSGGDADWPPLGVGGSADGSSNNQGTVDVCGAQPDVREGVLSTPSSVHYYEFDTEDCEYVVVHAEIIGVGGEEPENLSLDLAVFESETSMSEGDRPRRAMLTSGLCDSATERCIDWPADPGQKLLGVKVVDISFRGEVSYRVSVSCDPSCASLAEEGEACHSNDECADGLHCDDGGEEVMCGAGLQGVCAAGDLNGCPDIYGPECGCDNTTYANSCERLRAGVALDSVGECPLEDGPPARFGEACGGPAGVGCEDGLICDITDALECVETFTGTCVGAEPLDCSSARSELMCGCDGMTYQNDCERLNANAALASLGACE